MEKIRIGLTMIVKNESKVISRCLKSVFDAGFIDYYAIVDTGSHDDTKVIVKKLAEQYKVQGVIANKNFTDFSDCRNFSLDLLRDKVDWAFWIDADEVFKPSSIFSKDLLHNALSGSSFSNVKGSHESNTFYRPNFFKIEESTIWKGLVHEYVTLSGGEANVDDLCHIDIFSEGSSWNYEQKKFKNYINALLKMIEQEPNEPRWVYFLAESYRHLKNAESERTAMRWYEKRMKMSGGNAEEIFVSAMMYVSLKKKHYDEIELSVLDSFKYPDRIENLIIRGLYELEQGHHLQAFHIAEKTKPHWGKIPRAGIYVDPKTYLFTAPYMYAVSGFLLNKKNEIIQAVEICKKSGMMNMNELGTISMMEKSIYLRNKNDEEIRISEN